MADDRLDLLDYYELLRVEPSASTERIREAFHDFARRYHPDRHASAPPELQERAAQIYRRGAEAYRVLTQPEQRRRYDALVEGGKLRYEEPPATAARAPVGSDAEVRARTPRALPFVQKALDAERRGASSQAKLNFELALRYEPDNEPLRRRYEALLEAMKR